MKKERNIIIIVTIILACLTYAFFMTGYYSLDTQRVIAQGFDGYAIEDASFPDGRVFMGIICLIASKTNISYTLFYQIMLIGAIVISAFAVYKIYNIINHYKKAENKKEKIILYIIACIVACILNMLFVKIVSGGNGRVSQIGISILVKNLKGLKKTIIESNELFTGEKIKYNLEDSTEIREEYFKDQTEEIRMKVIGDTIYIGLNI